MADFGLAKQRLGTNSAMESVVAKRPETQHTSAVPVTVDKGQATNKRTIDAESLGAGVQAKSSCSEQEVGADEEAKTARTVLSEKPISEKRRRTPKQDVYAPTAASSTRGQGARAGAARKRLVRRTSDDSDAEDLEMAQVHFSKDPSG